MDVLAPHIARNFFLNRPSTFICVSYDIFVDCVHIIYKINLCSADVIQWLVFIEMEVFRVYLDIVLGSSLIIQTLRQDEHPVQNYCYHGPKSARYSCKSRFPIKCQSNWLCIKIICMELIISPLFEAAPLCLGPLWCLLVALHIL